MISRRIALLPAVAPREIADTVSVQFSRRIFEKSLLFKWSFVSVSLFYRKSSIRMPQQQTNIRNNTSVLHKNRSYSSVRQFASSVFIRHMHTYESVQVQHTHLTHFDGRFKTIHLPGKEGYCGSAAVRNILKNRVVSKRVESAEMFTERFVMNRQHNSHYLQTIRTNSVIERTKEAVSKGYNPQTLVYRSEKKVENISEELHQRRIHTREEETVLSERLNVSKAITKEDRIKQTREIESLSEKVYSLVIKKYDRERRRRGDLYA